MTESGDGGIQILIVEGVGSLLGDGDGGDVLEVGEEDWRTRLSEGADASVSVTRSDRPASSD